MEELQQQFDDLTEQKVALWESIKGNNLYERTSEWQEIRELDNKLLELRSKIEGGI